MHSTVTVMIMPASSTGMKNDEGILGVGCNNELEVKRDTLCVTKCIDIYIKLSQICIYFGGVCRGSWPRNVRDCSVIYFLKWTSRSGGVKEKSGRDLRCDA
jgi:hypothetical protein